MGVDSPNFRGPKSRNLGRLQAETEEAQDGIEESPAATYGAYLTRPACVPESINETMPKRTADG